MRKRLLVFVEIIVLVFALVHVHGEQTVWDCPGCGRTGNTKNFCRTCGNPAPWVESITNEKESDNNSHLAISTAESPKALLTEPLGIFSADGLTEIIFNPDGTYRFRLDVISIEDLGTWKYDNGILTLTDTNGKTSIGTGNPIKLHYSYYSGGDQISFDYSFPAFSSSSTRTFEKRSLNSALASTLNSEEFNTVGNIVSFGIYEQDNNTTNGLEPIEWIVLDYDEKGHKALLLSKYGLDSKPFNEYNHRLGPESWSRCTLRNWLNGFFLQSAFIAEERSAILTTSVDNSSSQGYERWNTSGENNTQDKVFLLSYAEMNEYLAIYSNMTQVTPTSYAIKQGAFTSSRNKTPEDTVAGWWWLRSPGLNKNSAAIVFTDGSCNSSSVRCEDGCVRPALWINLKSDIF